MTSTRPGAITAYCWAPEVGGRSRCHRRLLLTASPLQVMSVILDRTPDVCLSPDSRRIVDIPQPPIGAAQERKCLGLRHLPYHLNASSPSLPNLFSYV